MKPFNEMTIQEIDKFIDDFCKKIPLFGGKVAKELKEEAHKDRDHNGKVDLLEWMSKLQRTLDLLGELNEQVDFVALADFADELPFIKDKVAFKASMHKVAAEIEKAQKLAEAQKLLEGNK